MYRAITVKPNGIISGVHDSAVPFVTNHFARNPELANDAVVLIPESGEYRTGLHILCYNEDGTQKPDVWCIQNGYMALPPDKEIINGELVAIERPPEEAPETIKNVILGLQTKVTELEGKLAMQDEKIGRIEMKVEPVTPIGPINEAKL
jgi:hypothetical protein